VNAGLVMLGLETRQKISPIFFFGVRDGSHEIFVP